MNSIEISVHIMVRRPNFDKTNIQVLYSIKRKLWKIGDFGLTSEATSDRLLTTTSARRKPSYRAPELIRDSGSGYNSRTNLCSLLYIIRNDHGL